MSRLPFPALLAATVLLASGCDGRSSGRSPGAAEAAAPLGPDAAAPLPHPDAAPAADLAPHDGRTADSLAVEGPASDAAPEASSGAACTPAPVPRCDLAPPDPGARRAWRNSRSSVLASTGARHRGRDQLVTPGAPQWLIARFAYGLLDGALADEEVDVYLLRGCAGAWEKLGTVRTSASAGQHPPQEGVEDNGGRVYLQVPADRALGPGRHRVRFVVAGDLSATELFLEVVSPGAAMFVSDVDGTLTTSETAEFGALLTGALPDANPDAAAALSRLAEKGYRPMYLTARPEWLVERTREFLARAGFPPGIVHTTLGATGAMGMAAVTFKSAELTALRSKGLVPRYVFGNTDTDAQAYENGAIEPREHRVFFRYTDAQHRGRRIEAYSELFPELARVPAACVQSTTLAAFTGTGD